MTQIDRKKVMVLAGVLAVTNMGQPMPEVGAVVSALKFPPRNAEDAAIAFCGHLIESDEQLAVFSEEASMWVKLLQQKSEEQARQSWPDHFALLDRAEAMLG